MTRRLGKVGAVLGTALSLFAAGAKADEGAKLEVKGISGRATTGVSIEYDHWSMRNTVGLAPKGNYEGMLPSLHMVGEFFRANDVVEQRGDETSHYTTAGFMIPDMKLGSLNSTFLAGGAAGDVRGFYAESINTLGDFTLTGTVSHRDFPGRATHFGGGLDWQVSDGFMIGGGFDTVKERVELADEEGNPYYEDQRTNQFLGRATWDIDEHNRLAGAFVHVEEPDNTDTNTVSGYWMNYGNPVGWRFEGAATWNNDRDFESYSGQFTISQNPTNEKDWSKWLIGRGAREWDQYYRGVVPTTIGESDGLVLMDWVNPNGALARVGFVHTNDGLNTNDELYGSVGYVWGNPKDGRFGLIGNTAYTADKFPTFDDGGTHNGFDRDSQWYLGGELGYQKGNWSVGAGVNVPMNGDDRYATFGLTAQVSF
ncbi:MAG: hypothetical protein ABH864_00665 [archaeon]